MTFVFRAALVAALACAAGPNALSAQESAPPPTVTVVTLQPQDVTLTSTLPGRVHASAEAEVRPQVNGIITERLFEEGAEVSTGDVLYRIDPDSYDAALASAEASVAQAEAQLRAAERDSERLQTLSERGVSSSANADDALAARDSAAAALEVARASRRTAEIELARTEITARLSGRIGFSDVDEGALVTASQSTPLSVIRTLDPVHVDVTQSAADLLAWRQRGGSENVTSPGDLEVRLTLADGSSYDHTGRLSAAEPHVDEQTGVVVLRMTFPNPEHLLLPGMYVQVEMPTGNIGDVFLAPQEGVTRDRRGNPMALVVNGEGVVEERQLTVLQDMNDDWVVSEGLQPGDQLIVAGLQKVQPGATVNVEEREPQESANASGVNGETDIASAGE